MSRRESIIEVRDYIDTKNSSGDSKGVKTKIQEENNNEIDELSKEFTEMGCIVDAVKRPPNVCVETCVYESKDDEKTERYYTDDEDAYSDEFEDDKSEEEVSIETVERVTKSETTRGPSQTCVNLTKSQSLMSTNKPNSISGRSTNYGSISVPQTRRINMSFSNERLREIERHNHILLTKILSARNSKKSSVPARDPPTRRPIPPAAVLRKNQQRKIDHDNLILLKKIQRAKSSACSIRR
ncbi:uncharacterized protein LOC114239278 isoform X1 [Bombyx mandarina]|uniref:Uncharacterized protein LOC114239278 isoform X1 n=2 Tax=Bombyx mandarina TaxID=7092 RepID=A0A6J2J9G5_BOMMA|nr:uncharacterized protein LOC114239278 isoform X1 [Bombyx mandarina]XP_028025229.1 uncharacterized protein LOC114239278 isoform X1 [Bombyx mandarina]